MSGARIKGIAPGSPAAKHGIVAGDILLEINGKKPRDILDYLYASADTKVELLIRDREGREKRLMLEKDPDDDPGLEFDDIVFDGIMKCKNRCIFCFVDQMPRGMRKPLYLKDDDYRYSFFFGSFITLSNLEEEDWRRIRDYHISPLYISVHATIPDVREVMVRPRRKLDIREGLQRLAADGIEMHTQIVLCPGINDGEVLEQTVSDLAALYPAVRSIGIVPVGLTGFRERLPVLRPVDQEAAAELIEKGFIWQERFRRDTDEGLGLVYMADELFLKAGVPFPPAVYYDGYPQIENGIGLSRLFLDDWEKMVCDLPEEIKIFSRYILVCGESAAPIMSEVAARLNLIRNLEIEVLPIKNRFFGGRVTVTGLLTGQDIIHDLKKVKRGGTVIIPRVLLKEGEDRLLDDKRVSDIVEATGFPVKVAEPTAKGLIQALGLKKERSLRLRRGLIR